MARALVGSVACVRARIVCVCVYRYTSRITHTAAADLVCVCHTLCHVGEHFELTTLDAFMTPWLELVGGRGAHYGAKRLWKEMVSPTTVPGEP